VTGEFVCTGLLRKFHRIILGSLSGVMAFPGLTPPSDPLEVSGTFPLNTMKMDFMLS
jgi:hypothetical protein